MGQLIFLIHRKWSVPTRRVLAFFPTATRKHAGFLAILLFAALLLPQVHAEPLSASATTATNTAPLPAISTTNTPPENTNAPTSPEETTAANYKKMSLEQLMSLDVTTVSRTPQPFGQAPASIVVITSDEIRRSGASSIPEALRLADNLEVAQKNSHDWAISARGFNTSLANKLLVMIDGRTVYSPLFSGVFWNAQDYLLEDIDRIEVISGPGGTLWGANAVNGVINIITKNAKDTQGLYLEGGGGTELRDLGGVRYGTAFGTNVYLRVYGKWFQRGNEVYPDGSPADDSWQMGQGGFRMDAMASPNDDFTLQGDIYESDLNIPTGDEANQSGGNVLTRWSHLISDEADMSLQLYYDQTHLHDPESGFNTNEFVTDDLRTYDADFQYRTHMNDRNQVTWGLAYRFTHDVVQNSQILAFEPPVLDRHLYSAFIQDQITLLDNLFFTLGTKLEHNDYTGFELEPSGRLQWNVATNHMVWSAVSRAVRTPSRVDSDLREPNSPVPILAGSSRFESEALIAYELGYRAQITPKLSASLSTYYNDYTEIRSVNFTTGGVPLAPGGPGVLPLFFANDLEGHTEGVELSADYQVLEGWRLHFGYNLIGEHIHLKPGTFDLNNALNETADPKNQVFVRSSLDLPANIEFDNQFRWIDHFTINNGGLPAQVPSYAELDARLAWHATKWLEIAIVGQNLLHERHPEYGVPSAAPGGQEDIVRSVYGKISLRW